MSRRSRRIKLWEILGELQDGNSRSWAINRRCLQRQRVPVSHHGSAHLGARAIPVNLCIDNGNSLARRISPALNGRNVTHHYTCFHPGGMPARYESTYESTFVYQRGSSALMKDTIGLATHWLELATGSPHLISLVAPPFTPLSNEKEPGGSITATHQPRCQIAQVLVNRQQKVDIRGGRKACHLCRVDFLQITLTDGDNSVVSCN